MFIYSSFVENLFICVLRFEGKAVPLQHVKKKRKYKLLTKA